MEKKQDNQSALNATAQINSTAHSVMSTNENNPKLFQYKLPDKQNMFILPLVYSKFYDIYFFKLTSLHPFDVQKWGRIQKKLIDYFKKQQLDLVLISPLRAIKNEELELVHSKAFIRRITRSRFAIVKATEAPILGCFPLCLIRKKLLKSFKYQVSGSILTAFLSIKHKICINLGGGFHHCSANRAAGFCLFADITLMYQYLWRFVDHQLKILILDLDAHQGNGHEMDAFSLSPEQRKLLFIVDMYNFRNYPGDEKAKKQIDLKVELKPHTKDIAYLEYLRIELEEAIEEFKPDLMIYVAGSDILINDRLGGLDITPEGLIKRDEVVFREAKRNNISLAMLTAGGYAANNAQIIADSLINLYTKGYISRINLTS